MRLNHHETSIKSKWRTLGDHCARIVEHRRRAQVMFAKEVQQNRYLVFWPTEKKTSGENPKKKKKKIESK